MTDSTQLSSDKRVQRSKQAILTEPYKLLSEGGIGGVSIDEVSRRSGAGENIDSDNIKQHKTGRIASDEGRSMCVRKHGRPQQKPLNDYSGADEQNHERGGPSFFRASDDDEDARQVTG
jgi:hypothetical protein